MPLNHPKTKNKVLLQISGLVPVNYQSGHIIMFDQCSDQLVFEHKILETEGQGVQLEVMLPHHPGRQAFQA